MNDYIPDLTQLYPNGRGWNMSAREEALWDEYCLTHDVRSKIPLACIRCDHIHECNDECEYKKGE